MYLFKFVVDNGENPKQRIVLALMYRNEGKLLVTLYLIHWLFKQQPLCYVNKVGGVRLNGWDWTYIVLWKTTKIWQ